MNTCCRFICLLAFAGWGISASAQLFENLQAFPERLKPDDTETRAEGLNEGPKGIATADFNRDGKPDLAVSNLDGTVTYFQGSVGVEFSDPVHLRPGAKSLRQIVAADLNQDRLPDLAVAAPFDGKVFLFFNRGNGQFSDAVPVEAWIGVRSLASGDFDGDGVTDLAAGGPQKGVRHYRGLGDGTFAIVGDLPALDAAKFNFPKPVYLMKAVKSPDGKRDDLVVSHANSDRAWILSSQPKVRDADRILDGGFQNASPGTSTDSPIVITEFSAVNESVIADEDGDYPDWIELYNRSTEPVSLAGWSLADSLENGAERWTIPAVTLAAGRFMVVFASGKNRIDPASNLHASFRLASRGEVLGLHRPDGERVQRFPEPGSPRERLNPASPLAITEVGFAEDKSLADAGEQYWDYLRIENRSNSPITTPFWALSFANGAVWLPPEDRTLAPGETIPVFLSGKGLALGDELHSLPYELRQGSVALTDPSVQETFHLFDWGEIATEFPPQMADVSYGLGLNGGEFFFDEPTPGWVNNAGVKSLTDLASRNIAAVEFRQTEVGREVIVDTTGAEDQLLTPIYVWFCYDVGLSERHLVLRQEIEGETPTPKYVATLPAEYEPGNGYRVLALALDRSTDPVRPREVTIELASGGISIQTDVEPVRGALKVSAIIPGQKARAFDIGAIFQPASEGVLDLVSANRDTGNLEIRSGTTRSGMFSHVAEQIVRVPGGPRSVDVADLDGDGWNDVFVALRNFDRLVIFKNNQGKLTLASEVPTGVSPREVAVADFDEDGQLDAAVINRHSQDVSILPSHKGAAAFAKLDQVYDTDGEVSGLSVIDFDNDGRDDVVQLHRASGDVSVRLAGPRGRLSEPLFFSMGTDPRAAKHVDVNGDGLLDVITANMTGTGSINVRLRTKEGYTEPESFRLPDNASGGLFALEPGDFDGDGDIDVAAGYFDCRVAFYRGDGSGNFKYERNTFLNYESRVMTSGDYDNDGDLDLAGGGYGGDIVIFENPGDLLSDRATKRTKLSPRSDSWFGSREIRSEDLNGDGDLDFVFGTGNGVAIFFGAEGMSFNRTPVMVEATQYPTSGLSMTDFDGDGISDMAVSCQLLSCVTILKGNRDGSFDPTLVVDVPAGGYLATGDLDGDGLADLVGAGDVLWTSLSSRRSETVPSEPENTTRPAAAAIVINEILAINETVPLETDGGKRADWVELYNGTGEAVSIGGWKLILEGEDGDEPYAFEFEIPQGTIISSRDRKMIVYSPDRRTALHTGYRLPGSGATLRLTNAAGAEMDRVDYPEQQGDVAYGRYQDGAASFVFNPIPSPATANSFDGSPDPIVDFKGFDFKNLKPNQPVQVLVEGQDDLGIIGISMIYQRLDLPGTAPGAIQLYDDGQHGDGVMLDGVFGGALEPGLPPTGELQFYFVVEDLSGSRVEIPDETVFVDAGEKVRTYSVGFAGLDGLAPLEIVRVAADNQSGLRDETGTSEDYIEIRNTSGQVVSLGGIMLSKEFAASDQNTYAFPSAATLEPGESFIVYADGDEKEGSRHAPFRIDRGGDTLLLTGTAPRGARVVIDFLQTQRVESDALLTKIADTGIWAQTIPGQTVPGDYTKPWQGTAFDSNGTLVSALAFQTEPEVEYVVEFGSEENGWLEVARLVGDGELGTLTNAVTGGEFRLTELRPPVSPPELRTAAATAGKITATVSGQLASGGEAPTVTVFFGQSDAGASEEGWFSSATAELDASLEYRAKLESLDPGTSYVFRVQAKNSAGSAWSSAVVFDTLPANAPVLTDIVVTNPTSEGFRIAGRVSQASAVTVFYGLIDGREVPGAWQGKAAAVFNEDGVFVATVGGLEVATPYVVRVRASNPEEIAWSDAMNARTLTEVESLQRNLLLSEVMYHPNGGSVPFQEDDFEYIELFNAGTSTLNLANLAFVTGIAFEFENAGIQSIEPGQYVVVVANRQAFDDRYGNLDAAVAGEWLTPFRQTKLSNGGESIVLQHAESGASIHEFTYDDREPWPYKADGSGSSLMLGSNAPGQDHSDPENWTASISPAGTPGIAPVREPIFLRHPEGRAVEEAGRLTLTATVVGVPPMEFRWLKDGKTLEGPDTGSSESTVWLNFPVLSEKDSGNYVLVTTNEFGATTSEPAALVVAKRSTIPGSLDISFAPVDAGAAWDMVPLPGGEVLVVGPNSIRRLKPSGVPNPSFTPPSFGGGAQVVSAALLPDGKIMVVGTFSRVNGAARDGIARLHGDGTLDRSFDPQFIIEGSIWNVLAEPDGSVIVGGSFIAEVGPIVRQNIMRVLPAGNIDVSFMNDLTALADLTDNWRYRDNGDTFEAEWRTSGFDDSSWETGPGLLFVEQTVIDGPANTEINLTRGATTYYFRREMQNPFGRSIEADLLLSLYADDGAVVYINGEEILRLRLPQGVPITPGTVASPKVINAVQEGPFLIPNVTLDPGANVIAVEVHQESPRSSDVVFGLAIDTPSTPGAPTSLQVGASGGVTAMERAPGGKLVLGGPFTTISGAVRIGLARLHANGAVDTAFVPAMPFLNVWAIAVQADGKVITSGMIGGKSATIRFLPDGSIDGSFAPYTAGIVNTLTLGADGSIYAGVNVAGRGPIRLLPDGTEDPEFVTDIPNGEIKNLVVSGTDRLLVSGFFTEIDLVSRAKIASYILAPVVPTVALERSNNLLNWVLDQDAVVDVLGGSAHTLLPPADTTERYYRLNGSGGSIGVPVFGSGVLYFRIYE